MTTSATTRDLRRAATLFHALSNETRLSVLELLRANELCVCDVQDALDVAQSNLSFHLHVLKEAGLIADRREGRFIHYRIVPDSLKETHDLVVALHPTRRALPVRGGPCCG